MPSRYKKRFLAFNTKATNEHAACHNLAYCINVYANPNMLNYLNSRGAQLSQDAFALSQMIQWIWRSAIRRGEDVYLYIPSKRMRALLEQWIRDVQNGVDVQGILAHGAAAECQSARDAAA